SKGIITGSIMVFLPSLSGFAIPEILGKGNIFMLGNLIQQKFVQMEYYYGAILA
ncbi:MAG TPA: ABC transporter permease, partial [Lactobacillus acetotolerans]|nr:ABC transporter permease [Lactobacillus acetotolerans]